jgi:heat-inducible transcriptional repressor
MVRKSREETVLSVLVGLYLRTGKPVASGQVARCPSVLLSPATVRTVMAGLEERGLIVRPHPSAGAVPSDLGLRTVLDRDLPRRRVSHKVRNAIETRVNRAPGGMVAELSWIAELTATLTSEAGVAVRPMEDEPSLSSLSLVRLDRRRVLAVVVGDDGVVVKHVCNLKDEVEIEDVPRLASRAMEAFHGMPLDAIRRRLESEDGGRRWGPGERQLLSRALMPSGDVEVSVAGAEHLLDHEGLQQADRLRTAVGLLEDRAGLAREWRRTFASDPSTRVVLGGESRLTAEGSFGMVATLIQRSGRRVGAVGVIGPRRMDYARIVPVVDYIGKAITRRLEEPGAMHA